MQHGGKNIDLDLLTRENVQELFAHSDSSTFDYELPLNEEEANADVLTAINQQRYGIGGSYIAYDLADNRSLVGGGQVTKFGSAVKIGYWVVAARRRSGYGTAILESLEQNAFSMFDQLHKFELVINQHNLGSIALAQSMGYQKIYDVDQFGKTIFAKPVHEI